jgi:hypothetical protein
MLDEFYRSNNMPGKNNSHKDSGNADTPREDFLSSTGIRTVITKIKSGEKTHIVLSNDLPPKPESDITPCFHPLPY